jgi:DNA-binding NtrC family response regulator
MRDPTQRQESTPTAMATVRLLIADPAIRVTLKTMLEAQGHRIADDAAEVVVADDATAAAQEARTTPALIVTPAAGAAKAVDAMKQGVYGYILLPLVPGEAPLMVARAVASGKAAAKPADISVATLAEVERLHIETVLRLSKHNQAKAARALGIGRNTLWRKLKQYEIEKEE